MRRNLVTLVSALGVLIALGAFGFWWFMTRELPLHFAKDAVQVIAYEASDMFQRDPDTTENDIQQKIKSLHRASVINLKIDASGKAVDPFGTAFRVDCSIQSGMSVTTVTSAGPDRQFGTEDDIQFVHETEMVS